MTCAPESVVAVRSLQVGHDVGEKFLPVSRRSSDVFSTDFDVVQGLKAQDIPTYVLIRKHSRESEGQF